MPDYDTSRRQIPLVPISTQTPDMEPALISSASLSFSYSLSLPIPCSLFAPWLLYLAHCLHLLSDLLTHSFTHPQPTYYFINPRDSYVTVVASRHLVRVACTVLHGVAPPSPWWHSMRCTHSVCLPPVKESPPRTISL